MAFAAFLTATAVPLLFLLLVRTLDLYGTGSPRAVWLSFLWGAFSVFLSSAFYYFAQGQLQSAEAMLYVAPLLEETLKALVLLYLVRRPSFTYFVDGAIYGFAAGIGFAVFENYLYLYQEPGVGLGTALGRVLSTNLMHASAGAIVGIALGLSRFKRFSGRLMHLLSGLLLAILLHAAFNRLVAASADRRLFLYAMAVGLSGVAFTALTIRRGLAVEKKWIAESLGLTDRVTEAEVSAAGELEHAGVALQPLARIFGAQKASQIEQLLLLQAQLGILRKTRSRAQSSKQTYNALSEEIERRQAEMEAARRAIGAYTMASLRILFTEAGSPIWQRLEMDLNRRAAEQAGTATPANLFTLLERRSRGEEDRPE